MHTYLRMGVAVALCLYAIGGASVIRLPRLDANPAAVVVPLVVVPEPSRAMRTEVQPVARVVARMNIIDRLWLNYIYGNAARVVAADGVVEPQVIVTTEGLRAVHIAILKFIWRGLADNSPGEYDGLSEAINRVFNEVIGDERRGLTPELRSKAVEMFEALAWAGLGKDS
jgi:hypothetical protein